ncbi:MAG: DEAD/DEAH box helicase [Gammaproteobacteria bacterium]|nr:DEAD/DEAH box helicase [Gammaproteobacteria bacterium]
MSNQDEPINFQSLGLSEAVLKAIEEIGYETPSPIQAESIPALLDGRDILGQAQTGTGKTAAFALPILSNVDTSVKKTQLLVLTPTRELAIQVGEAFKNYGHFIKGLNVLSVYGGAAYQPQLNALRKGAHVVVGTPGRVMDHIRKGTLKIDQLSTLVLDEADEMLRMGFIEDVEWILEHTPEQRQIALFSATMPAVIKKITRNYLKDPIEIKIKSKTATATTIHQRFCQPTGMSKSDALIRILMAEEMDAVLIFVRTKTATAELAEKLSAKGYRAAALNGDIPQNLREKIVDKLKKKQIDVLVGTDVVGRGLDVTRISHVINYDIPFDAEAYVHRIGRTGRAGRSGDAITLVTGRDKKMLRIIEKSTKQKMEEMRVPTAKDLNKKRIEAFKQRITDTLEKDSYQIFYDLMVEYQAEYDADPLKMAAALAKLAQGREHLLLTDKEPRPAKGKGKPAERTARTERSPRTTGKQRPPKEVSSEARPLKEFPDIVMERYRLAVGKKDDVMPANIVGAIANEAEIDSCYIGGIEIYEDFSTVDLPEGMPPEVIKDLRKAYVCGQKLAIKPMKQGVGKAEKPARKKDETSKKREPKKSAARKKPRESATSKAKKPRPGKNARSKISKEKS